MRPLFIQTYSWADTFSGMLLGLMFVFGPWAFGTTEEWSIRAMNAAGWVLGALLLCKHWLRSGMWKPPRWAQIGGKPTWLVRATAVFSVAIPLYALAAALNARATYFPDGMRFEYRPALSWLPQSYDSRSTWAAFWTLGGLAWSFWALRDWVLGKAGAEQVSSMAAMRGGAPLPLRMRRLLWLLSINGALLGVEAIAQRISGSPRLLFAVLPEIHQTAEGQFGPYAYRSNAAQYFNLLWPVCAGFWWTLNQGGWTGRRRCHWLLVCAAVMAACPVISTSRGGALVAIAIVLGGTAVLVLTHFLFVPGKKPSPRGRLSPARLAVLFAGTALLLGFALGWKELHPRLRQMDEGFRGRREIAEVASQIARDFPVFGTGPGTYESVSELYRPPELSFWPAQVHNDWLETRVTYGWAGSLLIATAFVTVLARWFVPGGVYCGRRFILLAWLALAGCLAHAIYDFPFQVHSVLFLFVAWCSLLSVATRRPTSS